MEYSVEVCRKLEDEFRTAKIHRPMQVEQYEAQTELEYDITAVAGANEGKIRLVVVKFVGGGFAGQVYQVKVLNIESADGPVGGLEAGGIFAMKILIPPSGFSLFFRNTLYGIGFQGAFQLQSNPVAARSGALWQKFIRRAAKMRFGNEGAVADIHATFVDSTLGSCGELSEWIEGRTWWLEVDDRLDLLKRWRKGQLTDDDSPGSPEYRAKHEFMHRFVKLLHEMGAHEFARQYEWSTWKSQPNCLKRKDTEGNPAEGLVAVDFRAGLALLPFLPMSPGDVMLIGKGLMRGSLVQFDRGDIGKLERFIEAHSDEFIEMHGQLQELKEVEQVYRNSVPDITHNHFRLFYSAQLWSTIFERAITGWGIRNLIDERSQEKLHNYKTLTLLFWLIGIIPLIGRYFRRIWGQAYWRKHYWAMLKSWRYLKRSVRAKAAEKIIGWHRAGRIDEKHALNLVKHIWRFHFQVPFSILPAGLHRFITDWQYLKERLDFVIRRPIRLYFNTQVREQWLRDMVAEGKTKHILTDEDANIILSQIREPFIQKYLKSLAVHVCTVPVTQIVSLIVAVIYILMHPDMPRAQAYGIGLGIIALFQVVPVSPGSLVRGLYVVYLVIKERNFKDYNIAVFLGFFKYVGYLAFPIQMTYRYPALARFMAGHWATEAVHIVPVFGERGALLEHKVFSLFYNWPLTIRRRMSKRSQVRSAMKPRYWHVLLCAIAGSALFGFVDWTYFRKFGEQPGLVDLWMFVLLIPLLFGSIVTAGAGGATLTKRVISGIACGSIIGVLFTAISAILGYDGTIDVAETTTNFLWRVFIFPIMSTIGVLVTEVMLPEPRKT